MKCMTHFILFSYTIKNIWMCLNLEHQVRSTLFLLRNTNFRKTKWAQRPLFLSLRRFNVTTPPTKLTSQPPTSQVAKQICYCLSAQYESHASSWLDGKLQTKRDRVSLVRIFCFNSTTIRFFFLFLIWVDCQRVQRSHFCYDLCAISLEVNVVQACVKACVPPDTFRVICLCYLDFSVVVRIIKKIYLNSVCFIHCLCIIQSFAVNCCISLLTRGSYYFACNTGTTNSYLAYISDRQVPPISSVILVLQGYFHTKKTPHSEA